MNLTTSTRRSRTARWSQSLQLLILAIAILGSLPGDLPAQPNVNRAAQLYFFTNQGCAPCRQVEPGIEALKREGYPVSTIYVSQQPQLANQFNVHQTPTVVLVSDNRIVGRHAGLIDGTTLKQWFAAIGVPSGSAFANARVGNQETLPASSTAPARPARSPSSPRSPESRLAGPSTMHRGTRQPANQIERRALQSTVRLKVEDPEGISYATGTVVHRHNGECLVMTCGHVFREAGGEGRITAEFGFENGDLQSAPGQLLTYDADARDIGLVSIRTQHPFEPVPIASPDEEVSRGKKIFSIGCDHGESPTIRHSSIENRAAYDGSIKYDILGRPVDGRSGGGLFNEAGQLIGICNAALVDEDQGIYTALETIHWQIANNNLTHLFTPSTAVADNRRQPAAPVVMPVAGTSAQTFASAPPEDASRPLARISSTRDPLAPPTAGWPILPIRQV